MFSNLSSLLSAGKDLHRPESNVYFIFGCVKIITYRAFCKLSEQVFNPFINRITLSQYFFKNKVLRQPAKYVHLFFGGEISGHFNGKKHFQNLSL